MNILLLFPGFIVASIIVFCYEHKIRNLSTKSKNKVKFYVARDKCTNILYLYLGKPRRDADRFHACHNGCIVAAANSCTNLSDFGLNPKDFENLKFEDEPVEVFLNLND